MRRVNAPGSAQSIGAEQFVQRDCANPERASAKEMASRDVAGDARSALIELSLGPRTHSRVMKTSVLMIARATETKAATSSGGVLRAGVIPLITASAAAGSFAKSLRCAV